MHLPWLAAVNRDARILDYGCGYGRVTAELAGRGFADLTGLDFSPALIARARLLRPDLSFAVLDHPPMLPYADAHFDVVVLFAVLTCIADDQALGGLVAELARVLAPGGLLYVSDVPLQDDEHNQSRYTAYAERFGTPFGVFETADGAVCRHHAPADLRALLTGFTVAEERRIDVSTMNGHPAQAIQLLARRSG